MNKHTQRGLSNEIHKTAEIDSTAILSGWNFIGARAVIGKNCKIANFVEINSDCKIGDGTNIQTFTCLNSGTIIGKDCLLSDHVATADEKYPTPKTETIQRTPCEIGNNCIIGTNVTLICVKIGDNVVVGAGSVVTKNLPSNCVYVGNPAVRIMSRKQFDKKQTGFKI